MGLRKRRWISVLVVGLFILQLMAPAFAAETEQKTIRVGFPLFEGFSETDEQGNCGGFMYEYLNEVAKYTGWDYEFIPKGNEGLEDLLTMLEDGEIDLLIGLRKNAATQEMFDFPEYNCGITYSTLVVPRANTKYSSSDYSSFDGMRVAVASSATNRIEEMKQFFFANAIQAQIVPFKTTGEAAQAVEQGRADALLGADIVRKEHLRVVARFAAEPYYFGVTKGNTEVLSGLNMALSKIREVNINYDVQLYEKYFSSLNENIFLLTDAEKQYIETMEPLTVVAAGQRAPVEYFNKDGLFCGITANVFEEISQQTGLQFRFIQASTPQEAYEMALRGEAQILTGLYNDLRLKLPEKVVSFTSYLNLPYSVVEQRNRTNGEMGHRRAVVKGDQLNEEQDNQAELHYYDTLEDCIRAVEKGWSDYCFADSYAAEYCLRQNGMENLTMVSLAEANRQLCFGIVQPVDATLIGVMNKALGTITVEDMQEIIFNNTSVTRYDVKLTAFIRANVFEFFLVMLAFLGLLFFIVVRYLQKKRAVEERAMRRYRMLADITDEILLEYDYEKDVLNVSDKKAGELGLEPVTEHFLRKVREHQITLDKENILGQIFENQQGIRRSQYVREICKCAPDGTERWYRAVFMILRDRKGKPTVCMGKLRNIDVEREERSQLLDLARKDGLTGVYNKKTMETICEEFFSGVNQEDVHALLIFDIDNFKHVNDTYGHMSGDETLRQIVEMVKEPFTAMDVVGRIGGDEFAVLTVEQIDEALLRYKAEKVINNFKKPIQLAEGEVFVSCSIGIAFYPKDGATYEALYRKADTALYDMKNHGKCGYRCYQANMTQAEWGADRATKIESE